MQQLALNIDMPLLRSQCRPLDQPLPIYTILSSLSIGSAVPGNVYINDYEDTGEIPMWILYEREACNAGVQMLTLRDKATIEVNVFGEEKALAREVFIAPGKILAAPVYVWTPGCEKRRDKLGDIRQDARQYNERGGR
jgi:hypothetical protein